MNYTRRREWSQSRLSHLLHLEDYGWPITSLLSLINEDNELPLLPTKPWCSSAGGEERERGAGSCVYVCRRERGRKEETHREVSVSEGGYGVYESLNTGTIADPGALHVHLSSELKCV